MLEINKNTVVCVVLPSKKGPVVQNFVSLTLSLIFVEKKNFQQKITVYL